jgi:hypothetical protein
VTGKAFSAFLCVFCVKAFDFLPKRLNTKFTEKSEITEKFA